MVPNCTENDNGLLLHFQQLMQFAQCQIITSSAHSIRHLEYNGIHNRFSNGINIRFANLGTAGKSTYFVNFATERSHSSACDIDQVPTKLRVNSFVSCGKMTDDPGYQISFILLCKLHNTDVLLNCLPKFYAFVRFPWNRNVGKYHRTILRNIAQNLRNRLPIRFRKSK